LIDLISYRQGEVESAENDEDNKSSESSEDIGSDEFYDPNFQLVSSSEIADYTADDVSSSEETGLNDDFVDGYRRNTVYLKNGEPVEVIYEDDGDDDAGSEESSEYNDGDVDDGDYVVPVYEDSEEDSRMSKRSSQVTVEDPGVLTDSNGLCKKKFSFYNLILSCSNYIQLKCTFFFKSQNFKYFNLNEKVTIIKEDNFHSFKSLN
jgi:hypothetical protein